MTKISGQAGNNKRGKVLITFEGVRMTIFAADEQSVSRTLSVCLLP